MARTRLHVLPQDHPAAVMTHAAGGTLATTWLTKVFELMGAVALPGTPLDIDAHPSFCSRMAGARADTCTRKQLLKDFRWGVVRPALRDYDRSAFLKAASHIIPKMGIPFTVLQPEPERVPLELLTHDFCPASWRWYRLWAITRMTGRWPLPVLGYSSLPDTLHSCAACGASDVDVCHAFSSCHGTQLLSKALVTQTGLLTSGDLLPLLLALFGHRPLPATVPFTLLLLGRRC